MRAQAGAIDFTSLAPTLSRIYAFDLFVNNVDRHLTNYIVREQHFGTALLAFDYSRAWLVNGMPPPVLPMAVHHKTVSVIKALRGVLGDFFDKSEACHVSDRLSATNSSEVDKIILYHAKECLTKEQHHAILEWWSDSAKTSRINDIRKGVKDESCL